MSKTRKNHRNQIPFFNENNLKPPIMEPVYTDSQRYYTPRSSLRFRSPFKSVTANVSLDELKSFAGNDDNVALPTLECPDRSFGGDLSTLHYNFPGTTSSFGLRSH